MEQNGPCKDCTALFWLGDTEKIKAAGVANCKYAGQGGAGHIQQYPQPLLDFFQNELYVTAVHKASMKKAKTTARLNCIRYAK